MEISTLNYNLHKHRSFFLRMATDKKIKSIIDNASPDIVFLQETQEKISRSLKGAPVRINNKAKFLSGDQYYCAYSQNLHYRNGSGGHGNAILSKHPILEQENLDISVSKMERRGILYTKIKVGELNLSAFCTHLNLRSSDRAKQVKLLTEYISSKTTPHSPIILGGDFNDFDHKITRLLLDDGWYCGEIYKTFPNIFPTMSPDRIFSKNMQAVSSGVINNLHTRLLLSDHLPNYTNFHIG